MGFVIISSFVMATSLAEQLKKLRTPQTGLLLQNKKKPSLLFDPKEAANLDREIVLNIGKHYKKFFSFIPGSLAVPEIFYFKYFCSFQFKLTFFNFQYFNFFLII